MNRFSSQPPIFIIWDDSVEILSEVVSVQVTPSPTSRWTRCLPWRCSPSAACTGWASLSDQSDAIIIHQSEASNITSDQSGTSLIMQWISGWLHVGLLGQCGHSPELVPAWEQRLHREPGAEVSTGHGGLLYLYVTLPLSLADMDTDHWCGFPWRRHLSTQTTFSPSGPRAYLLMSRGTSAMMTHRNILLTRICSKGLNNTLMLRQF